MPGDDGTGLGWIRGLTDGKALTYVEPHEAVETATQPLYEHFCPDPRYSPLLADGVTRLVNKDPHGDLWYNSANNMTMHRYHSNSSATWDGTGKATLAKFLFPFVESDTGYGYHSALAYDGEQTLSGITTAGVMPSACTDAKSGWYEVRFTGVDSINALASFNLF